jgi:hypothetical protein
MSNFHRSKHSFRRSKIFGIGLSKTGTTSLTSALILLGYNAIHYPPTPELYDAIEQCDAATDTSVACRFRELDRRFPGSKFILTVRNIDDWLISARHHFVGRICRFDWELEVRRAIYGVTEWNHEEFRSAYFRHLSSVRSYFANRPADLLEFDLVGCHDWKALCAFLQVPAPTIPFPHEYRGAYPQKSETCIADVETP